VHFAAAVWALAWLGGVPPIPFGDRLLDPGAGGYVLGVLGIVWSLNLFNFMDGIDGIAASEASFMAFAGALLSIAMGGSASVPAIALALGCACVGFLAWNWPPAKIFMGDIGSGYIGYSLALVAILAARDHPVAWLVWLTLGAVFFVDATLTLARRVLRGERVHQAHRSHAYQWLARRFGHRRVTLGVIAVNVAWLLPCAWLASVYPSHAVSIALGALLPLVVAAVAAGSGRREVGTSTPR
jgi:Fuc2NAc and GlcNAc transferase